MSCNKKLGQFGYDAVINILYVTRLVSIADDFVVVLVGFEVHLLRGQAFLRWFLSGVACLSKRSKAHNPLKRESRSEVNKVATA